ncbi:Dammarenediol II synthase [Camellia lanceoleosa]|uniref:Dammarenediol II synthase n=1 Tax=Camellia lanceoleosa TaxID=1840588 RepID=A0ACC0GNL3_9ERIC|nr:Dammarenediol II synthase [Camellia lanceoleosa]
MDRFLSSALECDKLFELFTDFTYILIFNPPLKKENNNIDLSIPLVRLGEKEEVTYEAATIALRKAIRLNCAIQARDGHWAAENAGPMFFTPSLVSVHSYFIGYSLSVFYFHFAENTTKPIPIVQCFTCAYRITNQIFT